MQVASKSNLKHVHSMELTFYIAKLAVKYYWISYTSNYPFISPLEAHETLHQLAHDYRNMYVAVEIILNVMSISQGELNTFVNSKWCVVLPFSWILPGYAPETVIQIL